MQRQKTRKTDLGTILIHFWLVATLVVSVATGLRFAVDMSESAFLKWFEPVLPVRSIWILHMWAGLSVAALTVAYPLYLRATGLGRRISLDRARLAALFSNGSARWSAVNVLLYWVLFGCLAVQLVTGVALFVGYGGQIVQIHLFATWVIIGYAALHVVAHFASGGVAQLLRVLRPSAIRAPGAAGSAATPWARRSGSLGAATLALCLLLGLGVAGLALRYDGAARPVLQVSRVSGATLRSLKPDLTDSVWRAPPLQVQTNQGANFDGTGATAVEVRAVHDGEYLAMALSWPDPTRSLKHAPLLKASDGWHAMFTAPENMRDATLQNASFAESAPNHSENSIVEDKFAIMLTHVEKPFGPGAFHPGTKPLPGKPASFSGRGMHYTEDGSAVNVWLWHADGDPSMRCENARVGGPPKPTSDQVRGVAPYKGGFVAPVSELTVQENFAPTLPQDPLVTVTPLRLPKDPAAANANHADRLSADDGDPADAHWRLTDDESEPYSAERDARFPIGTLIPGLLAPVRRPAEPGDVYCSAIWAAGRWMLLVKRRLVTGRGDDIAIRSGTYMWMAAFDHTVADHTRHIRPIRLELKE